MHDVIDKEVIEVRINPYGSKLWVNVDGKCELRVNAPFADNPKPLVIVIEDQRLTEYKADAH